MTAKTRPRKAARDWTWQYRLRITLLDVRPAIWRELLVPETITLPKLHMAIQHAMGWTNLISRLQKSRQQPTHNSRGH